MNFDRLCDAIHTFWEKYRPGSRIDCSLHRSRIIRPAVTLCLEAAHIPIASPLLQFIAGGRIRELRCNTQCACRAGDECEGVPAKHAGVVSRSFHIECHSVPI